ncbi:MAG: anhydro-N-acetylmuramic acid kinase, partial [Candidatus Tectimicrobiota bacterium]
MSGTSADGVDAALTTIARYRGGAVGLTLEAFATFPYPQDLRARVLKVATVGRVRLEELARLHGELGEVFAEAARRLARRAKTPLAAVTAVGSHGQTVFHGPRPSEEPGQGAATLQLADPAVIAERTGCTVVADFRAADVAVGGEGAPLSPHGHALLFRHPRRGRLILNLGGIANVSAVPPGPRGRSPADVLAFDTGPGNMVLDALMEELSGGAEAFDRGGRRAARGRADGGLLAGLLKHPYFHRPPPKSTGREAFGRAFAMRVLRGVRRRGGGPEDALATATELTARSIAEQLERFVQAVGPYRELYLSGGGARNRTLVGMIQEALPALAVQPVDVLGIPAEALE